MADGDPKPSSTAPDPDTRDAEVTPARKKAKARTASQPSIPVDDAMKAKAGRIAQQLAQLFPDPAIPLTHGSSFQLLVAVMLSAQVGCRHHPSIGGLLCCVLRAVPRG